MSLLQSRKGILKEREAEYRTLEKEILERLAVALKDISDAISPDDLKHFEQARRNLDGLFLLVIAGEFNSGKSTFINALLGERVLPEGVTPTTDRINVLVYGEERGEELKEPFLLLRTHPSDLLRDISIVDTPGTNAILRRHEQLTRDFIPRCDLVLFVTSADRPFTDSEHQFLEQIRQWGKKIILIINKSDIFSSRKDLEEVMQFVRSNAEKLLGIPPELFAVSSRGAFQAKQDNDERRLRESGFEAVENYLNNTLDQKEKVRLKLLNPLNVAFRVSTLAKDVVYQRLHDLAGDVSAIENIERQLARYHQEMAADFESRLTAADSVLQETEGRAMKFFDENIRISKFRNLLKPDHFRREFHDQVIRDMPSQIEAEMRKVTNWLADRNLKLWQDIQEYIDRRRISRHRGELIGDVGSRFQYNRDVLFESIGLASREVLDSYNREAEALTLAGEVRDGITTTALAEVGAVSLGTLLVILAHTALADFTGILAATAVGVGGFYIVPAKRRRAKKEFHEKFETLRSQMRSVLTRQLQREITQSAERVQEAIAPYRRFILLQQEQLSTARDQLVTIESDLLRLKSQIEKL